MAPLIIGIIGIIGFALLVIRFQKEPLRSAFFGATLIKSLPCLPLRAMLRRAKGREGFFKKKGPSAKNAGRSRRIF
jgi:hypothetical protein